ncbi:MAG: HD domain-containing protein [Bryobacteraceae bacterium]|nr:HD domain-containing protein [Bryobacteraceae bacterium]
MKTPYISDLQPDQVTTGVFLVSVKDIRQKKSGDPFLSLILADKTGEIDAKMWDNVVEVMDTFERDAFVRVRGLPQIFQNKLQLTIHKLQAVPDSEVELGDFFPASRRDPGEMFAELNAQVNAMQNPHLRALLRAFLDDPEIARLYRLAPAAKSIHHAWLSGLLEHVLSLCTLAKVTAKHYAGIDEDLLLTGVVLHDIGKIHELGYERSFLYTTEGQLLGHIVIAMRMVDEKARQVPGFPPKLLTLVQHLVASHHGTLEFGSPKVPLFPEAMLLHHLDNLDSKMETMRGLIEKDARIAGHWTGYSSSLDRAVLKKDLYLAEALPPAPAPVKAPVRPANSSPFADKLNLALQSDPK